MSSRSVALAVGLAAMLVVGVLTGCTSAPTPPVETEIPPVVVDFTATAQPVKPVVVQIPVGGARSTAIRRERGSA